MSDNNIKQTQPTDEERKKYKEEQKQDLAKYKIGEKDSNGYTITKIFGRGDEYVVYEIETNDLVDSLKVWINTKIEEDTVPIDNYDKVRAKFSEVKGLLYKVVDKTTTKIIIAQIIINAIRGSFAEANTQFDTLIQKIHKEYKEQFKNRMRLLLSALGLTILMVFIAVFTYYNGCYKKFEHIHNLIYVLAGGSIGGFFSLSIGLNKLVCEQDVDWWLYILYGLERITIALLASVIMYFAIKCDLAFGICKEMDNPLIGYVFFGILAGFSETLVPNLLTNIEKEKGK